MENITNTITIFAKNIFIQSINFTEHSNSKNLEEMVKDTYERLEVITKNVRENKEKAQAKQKRYCDKNLKKRKVEHITIGDDVLIYDNAHKRSKGASLKPRFKGPYKVEHAKKDNFKVNVNGKLKTHICTNFQKGISSFS